MVDFYGCSAGYTTNNTWREMITKGYQNIQVNDLSFRQNEMDYCHKLICMTVRNIFHPKSADFKIVMKKKNEKFDIIFIRTLIIFIYEKKK